MPPPNSDPSRGSLCPPHTPPARWRHLHSCNERRSGDVRQETRECRLVNAQIKLTSERLLFNHHIAPNSHLSTIEDFSYLYNRLLFSMLPLFIKYKIEFNSYKILFWTVKRKITTGRQQNSPMFKSIYRFSKLSVIIFQSSVSFAIPPIMNNTHQALRCTVYRQHLSSAIHHECDDKLAWFKLKVAQSWSHYKSKRYKYLNYENFHPGFRSLM